MANIVSFDDVISGTADADIIIAKESSATFTDNTINAGGGNDVVIADRDSVFEDFGAGNGSFGAAINIDDSARWSTRPSLDVGDVSVPYTGILAAGGGEFDYFAVTIGAGETITLDIDYGDSLLGYGGPNFDTVIRLYDTNGTTQLATNDDSQTTDGGLGSFVGQFDSVYDSYLTYTAAAAGTYYFRVEEYFQSPITVGATYLLNVSVTGHANSNIAEYDDDTVYGEGGDDILQGVDGNDFLYGGDDNDRLYGGTGSDFLEGGTGTNYIDGGADFDSVSYLDAAAGVTVSLFKTGAQATGVSTDTLVSIESLFGSAFADTLLGNADANYLGGQNGDDTLNAGAGDDTLYGNDGDDLLIGGAGLDYLYGDDGADVLNGGLDGDLLVGGDGDDSYRVDHIDDVVIEFSGEGYDTVRSTIDWTLSDDVEALYLSAAARSGTGNGLDNVIFGSTGPDTLSGLGGNDNLRGLTGRDILLGGDGADRLIGGEQRDTLTGGTGADQFRFETLVDSGNTRQLADEITDFSHAEGDRIFLVNIDANTNLANDQRFTLIHGAAFHNVAGELRYSVVQGNTYLEGDVNGDGVADIIIRVDGAQTFVNGDFFF